MPRTDQDHVDWSTWQTYFLMLRIPDKKFSPLDLQRLIVQQTGLTYPKACNVIAYAYLRKRLFYSHKEQVWATRPFAERELVIEEGLEDQVKNPLRSDPLRVVPSAKKPRTAGANKCSRCKRLGHTVTKCPDLIKEEPVVEQLAEPAVNNESALETIPALVGGNKAPNKCRKCRKPGHNARSCKDDDTDP